VQGEEPQLNAEARVLAVRWLEDPGAVPPDMVETVLLLATRSGGADMQKRLLAALSREQAPPMRRLLVNALSAVNEPELARQQLGMLLEPAVDLREMVWLLMGATANIRTRQVGYTFLKENYDALAGRLPEQFLAMLPRVGTGFCDPAQRQDLEAFFSARTARAPGSERVLAQILERVDLCMALKAAQGQSVESFLSARRAPRP
jgi:alanyl aminopeptidase